MSRGAYHCLVVAAGTLSYLTLTPRQSSVAYRSDDCNESGTDTRYVRNRTLLTV
jgi:hypothetical protein